MNKIEEMPPEQLKALEQYKSIAEGKPVSLSIEDMPKIQQLSEELKEAEEQAKPVIEEIEQIKAEILEKRQKIQELQSQIDPRVLYLKQSAIVQPKPVNQESTNGKITEESILEVLQKGSMGNAEIAKALGLTGDKAQQNKIYGLCKKLSEAGKIQSANRMWKLT